MCHLPPCGGLPIAGATLNQGQGGKGPQRLPTSFEGVKWP